VARPGKQTPGFFKFSGFPRWGPLGRVRAFPRVFFSSGAFFRFVFFFFSSGPRLCFPFFLVPRRSFLFYFFFSGWFPFFFRGRRVLLGFGVSKNLARVFFFFGMGVAKLGGLLVTSRSRLHGPACPPRRPLGFSGPRFVFIYLLPHFLFTYTLPIPFFFPPVFIPVYSVFFFTNPPTLLPLLKFTV